SLRRRQEKKARFKFFSRSRPQRSAMSNGRLVTIGPSPIGWGAKTARPNCACGGRAAHHLTTRLRLPSHGFDLSCTSPKIFDRHGGQAERADVKTRHAKQAKIHGVRSVAVDTATALWPRHQMLRNIHATRTCHLPSICGRGLRNGEPARGYYAATLAHRPYHVLLRPATPDEQERAQQ